MDYHFDITGIDLNAPIDKMPAGFVPVMENWRPEGEHGALSVRPGQGQGIQLTDASSGVPVPVNSPVHSLKRIVDTSSGASLSSLFAGAGSRLNRINVLPSSLVGGSATGFDLDGPYSGDPLSLSVYRPTESVQPYMYVGDSVRMRKTDKFGSTIKRIGLPPFTNAPQAQLGVPLTNALVLGTANGWKTDHVLQPDPLFPSGATSLVDGLRISDGSDTRPVRTVTQFLFDATGTGAGSGWACVQPSSVQDIGPGMRIIIQPGIGSEQVTVQSVFAQSIVTRIKGIFFENTPTNTGRCAVHLYDPVTQIASDALVYNITRAEYARVLSVHPTNDSFTSFIISPPSAWTADDHVQCVASFRTYLSSNHAAGCGLLASYIQFFVGGGTGGGTGYVSHNLNVAAGQGDLSKIQESATGKHRVVGFRAPDAPQTRPDDIMGIDLWVDKPALLTEIKIMLDIDPNTTDVTSIGDLNQPFLQNYLQHVIRANDFAQSAANLQTLFTATANNAQRGIVEGGLSGSGIGGDIQGTPDNIPPPPIETPPPGNTAPIPDRSNQTESSQNQYSAIRFRIGELLMPDLGKIGSNQNVGLADIKGLRIQVTATGLVTVRFMGWYVTGGYGPDVADEDRAYIYAVRARDSQTGVVSNLSPAFRGGVRPQRQQIQLTCSKHPAAECDKLDWFRYGGKILGWHYVGTSENSANPEFWDTFSDTDLQFHDTLDNGYNEHYQPWPQLGLPYRTSAYGAGTLVILQTRFDQMRLIAPGTGIKIAGDDYTVYRCFSSAAGGIFGALGTVVIELTESFGYTDTLVPVEIPAPTWLQSVVTTSGTIVERADYFPVFTGPFYGFYFGLGDKLNAGWLYITNGNDPDSTSDVLKIEVTQPSEPLQNILVFEEQGRCILWSSDRTFVVEPSFGGGTIPFTIREISASVGLAARWACCAAGGTAVFESKDGLYETTGGAVQYVSESLRAIFPHEGSAGYSPNTKAYIVDLRPATASQHRLAYADRELYFDYPDVTGTMRTLVVRRIGSGVSGWRSYTYAIPASLHYADEGDGNHATLLGGINGKFYQLSRLQSDDSGSAIVATLQTGAIYPGDGEVRSARYVKDEYLDFDPQTAIITVTPQFDNATVSLAASALTGAAGRTSATIDLNTGQGQRARNCSLLIATSVTTQRPVLFHWVVSYSARPDTTLLRGEDYAPTKSGTAEWVRGVWIHADTYNQARSALFEYIRDDGTTASIAIAGITHAVYGRQFYPVPGGIYITAARLRPTDGNKWDFAGYELEGEPAPPLSTQPSAWQYVREGGGATLVQTVLLDADTEGVPVAIQLQADENTIEATIAAGQNGGPLLCAGRGEKVFTIAAPFVAHLIRVVPQQRARIFRVAPQGIPYPEITSDPSPWTRPGGEGETGVARFVQGLIIHADTLGQPVRVQIEADGVVVTIIDGVTNMGPLLTATEMEVPFAFDVPFIAHLVRATPLDNPWRLWGLQWDSRPEADLAYEWRTQQRAFGKFMVFGDGYISVRSTDDIVFNIIADGITYPVTFYDAHQNTANARRRLRFRCPTIKAKSVEFEVHAVTAAGRVAVYELDFTLEMKEWGSQEGWQMINPLGNLHFAQVPRWLSRSGAEI